MASRLQRPIISLDLKVDRVEVLRCPGEKHIFVWFCMSEALML